LNEGISNRAATLAAATWGIVAGCCYYFGKFTPGREGFEVIGAGIDNRISGSDHWSYGIGAAVWNLIGNLPTNSPSTSSTDEVEPDLYDYDDDVDGDGDDDDSDEVMYFEQ